MPTGFDAADQSRGSAAAIEDADTVARAFEALDADERALLTLHHLRGEPVARIAAALGIPIGTVKWRLHAARRALERSLAEGQR